MLPSPAVSSVERFSRAGDKSERRTSVPGPHAASHHLPRSTNPPGQLRPRILTPNPLTLFRTEWMDGPVSWWVEGREEREASSPKLIQGCPGPIQPSETHTARQASSNRGSRPMWFSNPSQPAQLRKHPATLAHAWRSPNQPPSQRLAQQFASTPSNYEGPNSSFDIPPVVRY
ncbi:hypothetical protein CPAR01_13738 [Colletotrichum paranaense]|uniref:Uncharacterized protein n=1 Tax=Colletotrichum paranaense TaxID=1914294 RepID=A0ABQ9S595_9PEZI|nr:uncharacterized protein CPAR01_13738 [Colletotrichum paranaense]KAK1524790.1 hypothetical protein CPAR01_13738 [Colletotrichum paranaense]